MLKVLGRITSINVRKVLWAADEMGLAYAREDWGKPIRDPNVPEFLALNPNGQVPVVIDEGFVLWESGAVVRYLAEKAASDLWPKDVRERALVDQWTTWQSTEPSPASSYAARAILRNDPPNPDPARLADSIASWTRQLRTLEGHLAASAVFVVNGRFSLADIAIGLSTHRWITMTFDKPTLPAVEAHYAAMKERPAAAAYLGKATP